MSNQCLSWSPENDYYNSLSLFFFVPTFGLHIIFWIQVCLYKPLRHLSLLWIYNYLALDLISLTQVLLEYISRHSKLCGLNRIGYCISCVLEAYSNDYTTLVQACALILMNFYRYRLIVKNQPISSRHISILILTHLFIYSAPLVIFGIQHVVAATEVVNAVGESCTVEHLVTFNKFLNLLAFVIIPNVFNIPIVFKTIEHVRSSQNAVRSVRRIHRRLIIQFIILYTIWTLFFLPQVIFMLSIASSKAEGFITKMLDIAGALSDICVITLFDRRFIDAWKKSLRRLSKLITGKNRQIHPGVIQNIQLIPMKCT